MEMHEGWLRKDPSTVLDEDFNHSSQWWVYMCFMLWSIKQPGDESTAQEKRKRRGPKIVDGETFKDWDQTMFFVLLPIFFLFNQAKSTEGSVVSNCSW